MVDYVLIDVAFAVPRLAGRLHDSRSPRCQPVASSPIRTYTQSQLTCDNDRNEAFHELLVFSKRSFHMARLRLLQGRKSRRRMSSWPKTSSRAAYKDRRKTPTIPSSTSSIPSALIAIALSQKTGELSASTWSHVLHRVSQRSRRLPARSQGTEKGRRAPAARALQRDRRYVKSLKKDELQKQLYNALLELEERNNRY